MCFFFNDTATTEIYTLSLHDALPIYLLPWMDADNFNPGYLMRSMHLMPKRGADPIWQHTQDYWQEREDLPAIALDAEEFVYARRGAVESPRPDVEHVTAA